MVSYKIISSKIIYFLKFYIKKNQKHFIHLLPMNTYLVTTCIIHKVAFLTHKVSCYEHPLLHACMFQAHIQSYSLCIKKKYKKKSVHKMSVEYQLIYRRIPYKSIN